MAIVCILLGILEIVVAIATLVTSEGAWLNIGLGIGFIISGLVYFYISYLGFSKANKSYTSENIEALEAEIKLLKYDMTKQTKRLKNNEALSSAAIGELVEIKKELLHYSIGKKVTLKKSLKTIDGDVLPVGTVGNILLQKGNASLIEIVGEEKSWLIHCESSDIEEMNDD